MSYKVLVVDDEPRIHTFIRISLSAEGFDYIGASTIAEAKACFEAHSPHVILLDLGLPDGDGTEFLNTLRQTYKTPVLVLTARDQEEEKIRLLEAGANDYLSKPFGVKSSSRASKCWFEIWWMSKPSLMSWWLAESKSSKVLTNFGWIRGKFHSPRKSFLSLNS